MGGDEIGFGIGFVIVILNEFCNYIYNFKKFKKKHYGAITFFFRSKAKTNISKSLSVSFIFAKLLLSQINLAIQSI